MPLVIVVDAFVLAMFPTQVLYYSYSVFLQILYHLRINSVCLTQVICCGHLTAVRMSLELSALVLAGGRR